jgi:glyoxylase I family protein
VPLPLHHLAVVVADLAKAERFYVEVLGLPVLRRWDDASGSPRSVWVELVGGGFLAIERAGASEARRTDEAPGFHCVAFGITAGERERWRTRMAEAGHPVERETPSTLYVRDPDGNLVALSHW